MNEWTSEPASRSSFLNAKKRNDTPPVARLGDRGDDNPGCVGGLEEVWILKSGLQGTRMKDSNDDTKFKLSIDRSTDWQSDWQSDWQTRQTYGQAAARKKGKQEPATNERLPRETNSSVLPARFLSSNLSGLLLVVESFERNCSENSKDCNKLLKKQQRTKQTWRSPHRVGQWMSEVKRRFKVRGRRRHIASTTVVGVVYRLGICPLLIILGGADAFQGFSFPVLFSTISYTSSFSFLFLFLCVFVSLFSGWINGYWIHPRLHVCNDLLRPEHE